MSFYLPEQKVRDPKFFTEFLEKTVTTKEIEPAFKELESIDDFDCIDDTFVSQSVVEENSNGLRKTFYSKGIKIFKELSDICEGYESTEDTVIQEMETLLVKAKQLVQKKKNSSFHIDGEIISSNLPIEKEKVYHRKRGRHENYRDA